MTTEQVHQCAKVARSSPPIQEYQNEPHPFATSTHATKEQEPQERPDQEPSQTQTDLKDNIVAALRGFMSMGVYMCGPSTEDPNQENPEQEEKEDSQSVVSAKSVQEYQEEKSSQERMDSISLDDYIFEDTSTDDGHIAPRATVDLAPPKLGPIPEEEQKEEPATSRPHEDIFEFSDNESQSPSCKKSEQEEVREEYEEESIKAETIKTEEKSQDVDSPLNMMGSFDMVETEHNFYNSKRHWYKVQPRLLSPTRFEI